MRFTTRCSQEPKADRCTQLLALNFYKVIGSILLKHIENIKNSDTRDAFEDMQCLRGLWTLSFSEWKLFAFRF